MLPILTLKADKLFRIEKREGMIKSLKEEIDSFRYEISRADKSIKKIIPLWKSWKTF